MYDVQTILLLLLSGNALSWWGAVEGSILRVNALDYFYVRAIGAPITLLMLVLQVIKKRRDNLHRFCIFMYPFLYGEASNCVMP